MKEIAHTPHAVRKHDGRIVPFDARRLRQSLARAGAEAGVWPPAGEAEEFGKKAAAVIADELARRLPEVAPTEEIRRTAVRVLRECGLEIAADTYLGHARKTAELLWQLRVSEGPPPNNKATGKNTAGGTPWDRRRLAEALRASGIAPDPAGETAREVERQLTVLGRRCVSPALVHALTVQVIGERNLDPRPYAARRVAVSFTDATTPMTATAEANKAAVSPLENTLQAYWLQVVHSPATVEAVRANRLCLAPYPPLPQGSAATTLPSPAGTEIFLAPVDPLTAGTEARRPKSGNNLWRLQAKGAKQREEAARQAAAWPAVKQKSRPFLAGETGLEVWVQPPASGWSSGGGPPPAAPISLNVCGLLVREGVRDRKGAAEKQARAFSAAVRAHREREEYLGFSPVRGRLLPVAAAGLWNAAAWLQGLPFDSPAPTTGNADTAAFLVESLAAAAAAAREATELRLVLFAEPPPAAARTLYRNDRAFFARDGLRFADEKEGGGYRTDISLTGREDRRFVEELASFLRRTARSLVLPPALNLTVPLGTERSADAWHALFAAAAEQGVARLRLRPGGCRAALRRVTRALFSGVDSLFNERLF